MQLNKNPDAQVRWARSNLLTADRESALSFNQRSMGNINQEANQ